MANNDPMQIDITLQATEPLNVSLGEMYKGGDGSFAGLSDVSLDNPTNGQVPKYNSETAKWENADDNTVSNLTDLEDVDIDNPTDGQIVRYDADTDKFVASDEQVGDSVSVTQVVSQGTKIATVDVNGTDTDLYAPNPTSVSVTQTQATGTKVGEVTVDGQTTELFAPTPTSPTSVEVTQVQTEGTKIATIGVNGVDTDLFAPQGGGGGASSADEVSFDDTDVAFSADDVQEAFEKITKSLTWAEYQALSDAEKNNGTTYFITDVNGDGQNFQPVIYSEEEREIGVWTDGKPLYERVIDLEADTSISYNSWTLTTVSLSGIDRLVLIQGLNSSGTAFFGDLLGGNNNDYLQLQTSRNGDTVAVQYLIFRYTKTTDQPGSGTWTPQGVPAVHYSEDEHVVGTWIDGKTLYEKTINFGALPAATDKSVAHGISNLGNVVSISGVAREPNAGVSLILPYVNNSTDRIGIYVDATNINVATSTNVSGYTSTIITIRYTKTSS